MAGAQLVTMFPVRNMSRAIKFYTKNLGGKLMMRAPGRMKNFWASMKLGETEIWFVNPPEREKRKLAYSALVVKNIKATVRKLKGNGVKFQRAERMNKDTRVEGPIAFDAFGASAFFQDSEGNLLMVWQNSQSM